MSSIYEQTLFSTLRIELLNKNDETLGVGTGFLLQKEIADNVYKTYLVSNKHILCATEKVAITFSKKNNDQFAIGETVRIPLYLSNETISTHPNPNIDVAVIDCTWLLNMYDEELFYMTVPYGMMATFKEPELSVAETVSFVGYPDDRYDKSNNLPLLRSGTISSHPRYDFDGNPTFIIDAQVFPGSSGSPVFIDLNYENIRNGRLIVGEHNFKLLGIVSATMIRNNMLKAIQTNTLLTTEEVLGLGIVFKATSIREIIDAMPF